MPPSVLVTGGSSGIGAACVRRFLAEGWAVAAVARRRARLDAVGAQCRPGAGLFLPVEADLAAATEIRRLAGAVAQWRASLQAVVLCAGDFLVAPIEATSSAEFERVWRITVWSKFYLVRQLLRLLADDEPNAPPRALIHIASLAAHQDFTDETAYTSAMHGVIGLARAQDVELRHQGIRASVVSPGLVRTELTERSFPAAALEGALPPGAIAEDVFSLVRVIRGGGYVGEIFHVPGR